MAWYTMMDRQGRGWHVDPEGAAHVIRSSLYNRELVTRSRTIVRSHGFGMPHTTEVETNFTGIRPAVDQQSRTYVDQLSNDVATDPRRLYEWLVHVREDGLRAGESHRQMQQAASRATARAIESTVNFWQGAESVARFVRDTSAGILFIGATVLSGGTALAVGAGATGLTFTGNTQDNLAQNQTMRQAMGNAAISTSFAVVTNLLIPRGLGAVGRGITGVTATGQAARSLTMGENVVLGLLSVQANIAADAAKTALTSQTTAGPVSQAAAQQMQRQIGARSGFEIGAMVFQSWLASRGIPAVGILNRNEQVVSSVTGGVLAAVGDRIVAAIADQSVEGQNRLGDLDMMMTDLQRTADAENFVREIAIRPA